MPKFYMNKHTWLGIGTLIVIVLGVSIVLAITSQSSNNSNSSATSTSGVDFVKYYNSTTASGYAQTLFNNLSIGDITSTQCTSFGKKVGDGYMANFKTVAPVLLLDYTYLYKKNRCIGLTNELLNGDPKNGNTLKVVDLGVINENPYGSAYIASCTQDLKSRPDIGMITKCDDAFGNAYDTLNVSGDKPLNSMSPMLQETYQELQKLGQQ